MFKLPCVATMLVTKIGMKEYISNKRLLGVSQESDTDSTLLMVSTTHQDTVAECWISRAEMHTLHPVLCFPGGTNRNSFCSFNFLSLSSEVTDNDSSLTLQDPASPRSFEGQCSTDCGVCFCARVSNCSSWVFVVDGNISACALLLGSISGL